MRSESPPQAPPAPDTLRWGALRRRWGLGLFPPLLMVWLALNGGSGWLVGIAAAAAGAAVGATLSPGHAYPWRPVKLLAFCGYFLLQSLRGGIDVARQALHPDLPIEPCWVEYRLRLPAGQPRTLMLALANLLPGSLVADLDPRTGTVRVHVLARGFEPDLEGLETRIAAIFGLPVGPGR